MTGSDDAPTSSIIIVSTNEARWLEPCLRTVFEHAGDAKLDVVVVDNGSTDGTRELVESAFPKARVVDSENHGFAHANNRGAMTSTRATCSSSTRTPRSWRAPSASWSRRWTPVPTSVSPACGR